MARGTLTILAALLFASCPSSDDPCDEEAGKVLCGYCREDAVLSSNPHAGMCRYCPAGTVCDGDICGELRCLGGKRIFATREMYTGDLKTAGGGATGIEGADNICALTAAAAALGGTWKAWLSDPTANAIDRIADVGPWYRMDRATIVFNNKANLSLGPVVGVTMDQHASIACNGCWRAWTGTSMGGIKAAATCEGWTSAAMSSRGLVGEVTALGSAWTAEFESTCDEQRKIYCIEQ